MVNTPFPIMRRQRILCPSVSTPHGRGDTINAKLLAVVFACENIVKFLWYLHQNGSAFKGCYVWYLSKFSEIESSCLGLKLGDLFVSNGKRAGVCELKKTLISFDVCAEDEQFALPRTSAVDR